MAILITGAGMIGSMTAWRLGQKGEKPVLYDMAPQHDFLSSFLDYGTAKVVTGDILDVPRLIDTIHSEKIDRIIHTAALATPEIRSRPFAAVTVNIGGAAAVMEAARLTGVKRVVLASTTAVYEGAATVPPGGYEEDYETRCLSNRQKWLYPVTKHAAEQIGLVYADAYGVDFIALRLCGAFGWWKGRPSGAGSAMLMHALVSGPALGRPVVLDDPWILKMFSAGKLDLLYAKDAGKALSLACFAPDLKQKVYNVSGGRFLDLGEIIAAVRKVIPGARITLSDRIAQSPSGPTVISDPVNITAARMGLGYEPDFDIENAVRDYCDWLRRSG
ncbi:MAG: NAD(P)-dependent oxidoreductase [Chloroflexi bacterium]|nr:NAD(P)-dependent oxidoreductase [Chloroflexota bacterium]